MPSLRNTGMNSMSELFAMKKNIASQAKFDHKMHSMSRDFYHRKDNMNQDIKKMFNDMRAIQSSTGYILEGGEHVHHANSAIRRPTLPKLYLPPIGVRLVKKYVGIDLERRKSLFDPPAIDECDTTGGNKDELPRVSRSFRSMLLKEPVSNMNSGPTVDNGISLTKNQRIFIEDNSVSKRADEYIRKNASGEDVKDILDETISKTISNEQCESSGVSFNSPDEGIEESHVENNTKISGSVHQLSQEIDIDNENPENKPTSDDAVKYFDEQRRVTFVSTARRSSRSTYRKRLSARAPTKSGLLRQHNLDIIESTGDIKKTKLPGAFTEHGKFYLDYGDGKLHTTMEIPKTKDCARPWCNPTCKTCQNRTMGKPCFILIPAGNAKQQSMLLLQKRRASVFPMFKEASTVSQSKSISSGTAESLDMTDMGDIANEENEGIDGEIQTDNEQADDFDDDQMRESNADDELGKEEIETIEKLLHINKNRHKRGYDRKRLDMLALPRGGPPAEVRFSKWSLRRKQEQLKEKASTEQLSEYEKDNLSMIQGKISVFLALLNQYEATTVPKKMVHLPIREDIHTRRRKPKPKRPRPRKSVFFSERVRARLLS